MKPVVAAALASIAALGMLSACSDTKSSSRPIVSGPTVSGPTVSGPPGSGFVFPEETTTVPGGTATGLTVPQATIDLMIAQFEANGLKVDKACFTALLKDPTLLKLVSASSGGATPSPEVIQKFIGCLGS